MDYSRGMTVSINDTRSKIWSTEQLPPAERLDYWIGAICEAFLEMHASAYNVEHFHARLEAVSLDALVVNCVTHTPQNIYRRKADIARSRDNYSYLICNTTSAWQVSQEHIASHLLPGDMVVLDSRSRYELNFPTSANTVSVQLPIGWLETWLPASQQLLGRRLDGQQGWGLALRTLLQQLTVDSVESLVLPARLIADQIGALLSLTAQAHTSGEVGSSRSGALVEKIKQGIRVRCAEPGLVASSIADDVCVSVRTLHRHLAIAGCTFAEILMTERIALAHRMLTSPAFVRLNIAEIGYRVGLTDPSHFARAYKRRIGVSPARARTKN
ncbi:helix-turn-helix domain-containing protein [Duganella radicis]|uniref:Helix-turn-helix domain-containing protein n=1 Tax=Duganella radicis TaxID=551988 RepID=A0A6L6PDT7_9BURK|nr:helix-turn-helix domain-containing protein [Duganella radicis]MTV37208.1 helix-turn-helix domain-containing protein [Duganella radicis]